MMIREVRLMDIIEIMTMMIKSTKWMKRMNVHYLSIYIKHRHYNILHVYQLQCRLLNEFTCIYTKKRVYTRKCILQIQIFQVSQCLCVYQDIQMPNIQSLNFLVTSVEFNFAWCKVCTQINGLSADLYFYFLDDIFQFSMCYGSLYGKVSYISLSNLVSRLPI